MAKYTAGELKDMVKSGHAIKNAAGDPSYPIKDADDLDNAIHAVGRGGSDHDAIRRHIISRAKALGLSSKIPDNWGGDGSLKGASAAGTPLELRKRRRLSMTGQLERRRMPFARGSIELRAKPNGTGGTNYEFEGYGAVFDAPFDMWDRWGDPYTEIVRPGAFSQTLSAPGLDVPFLVGHNDQGIPLARTRSGTMQLSQDRHGLHVLAQMDGRSSQARDLAVAVERGDLDEMSIGFITMPGGHQWSDDVMTREMLNLDLHRGDVSAVALAANPATAGARMVALPSETLSRRPGERRDGGGAPDDDTPDYDPQPHAIPSAMHCPNPDCTVEGGAMNAPDAKHCDQCGAALYSADGTIVLGDSGVPEELEGDAAMALAAGRDLETLRRRLDLLKLTA